MSGGMSGRGSRVSSGDAERQREINSEAPVVADLGRRIAALFRPYRGQLAVIIVMVLISAALGILPPLLTQRVFDDGLFPPVGGPDLPVLAWLVAAMIAVFVVSSGLGIVQTLVTARVGNRVMGDLRVRLFAHLQSMELGFFTRTQTGVIQSRLQNDVGGVANVLTNTVSNVIGNTVTVIAAGVAMLLLSWQLTIVALVLMPVLVLAQRRVGQVRARIAGRTQESLSEMTAITQEALSVSGVLLAKTYSRQRDETERYAAENRTQIDLQVRQTMSGQVFFALVQVFLSAVPAIVYLVSGWIMARALGEGFDPGITAGTIVAFTTVQSRLLFPLLALMRIALDLQTSRALFARIFEYLDLEPAIVDAPDAREPSDEPGRAGRVEFDDVSFHYPDAASPRPAAVRRAEDGDADSADGGDARDPDDASRAPDGGDPLAAGGARATIDRVSFHVRPGEFVAFVGASGSGKTTIGSLIPRLYDATSGSVRYAGDDVRELRQEALMDRIGVVTQEPYLFHATIAANLRYAKPAATQEELEAAARLANIHDTIQGFAEGYETVVGERGYRLSGGEKQRIAIARVLLKNPRVLVLDEATSALDTVNERAVQRALDDARSGRTTIAIAHRLSTVVDADRIYVVGAGRILEQGTHAELLERGGAYAELYAQQS
ncbi:ABC transporter ATP-binding protein [Leucobacter triazinivorans]|uniref:ABC transporter ATP-binding protein n=1 Tax=Leucobacter triazinivorans TaxID=1784719 RepID=A0A4P6KIF4_9MICO|nr:ABC transporter ATP-binding protein [Leucobacter triazinivorans]QBE50296.1 ABC transporter ATP-binding protein [Leucobacter triazinivorans]